MSATFTLGGHQDIGSLLLKDAVETRIANVEGFEPAWLERLASRMEPSKPAREFAVKAVHTRLLTADRAQKKFALRSGRSSATTSGRASVHAK